MMNDPKRLKSMQNSLQLACLISEMKHFEQQEKAKKEGNHLAEQQQKAPGAILKLQKKNG